MLASREGLAESSSADPRADDGSPNAFGHRPVDRWSVGARVAALWSSFAQAVGAARNRIEHLGLWSRIAQLSTAFEARVLERVADLDRAWTRRRAELGRRRNARRGLRLAGVALENTAEGMVVTDSTLRILAVNRAFCEITGYGALEVIGEPASLLRSDRHEPRFYDAIRESIGSRGHWRGEIWNRRKSGATHSELLSISVVRNPAGEVTHYVGVLSNTSAIQESEARFEFLAHHDSLTGLPNRLLFTDRGEHALERAHRAATRMAVMVLDLDFDRFEHLDDTLGHPAGDGLLRKVAERLTACLRAGDTVGRLGGDQFTVLLEELPDAASAGALARQMLAALAEPFTLGGNQLFVSASVGVSLFPEDGADLATLMKLAASAMHRAKTQPGGSVQFYTAELTRTASERFQLESGLRQAIRRDELVLHFQPQVSIESGAIVGAEALLRWRHPDLGLMLPDRFVPLAEETGLIEGIGSWVLRTTCRQVCAWIADGLPALRVAVNLSAHEISSPLLIERVAAALNETGIDPRLLELEITESAVMDDLEGAVTTLTALKQLGVKLALDDFGTGYSSLNYLRRFPIDRLKLDGSFIRLVADERTDQAIARAAIELGHGLGLDVVAEGVETSGQLDFLRANGCDAFQGHLFAVALPAPEIGEMLRRSAS